MNEPAANSAHDPRKADSTSDEAEVATRASHGGPDSRTGRVARLVELGLVVVVAGAYATAVHDGFVSYDDYQQILTNPAVVDPASVPFGHRLLTPSVGYIIPVTVWVWGVLFAMGTGGLAFHIAGVAGHTLCAWAVFRLGRHLSGALWLPATAALLFALHPITAEPVSWAVGLKDVLALALALLATLSFLRADRVWWAMIAFVLGTLAALSKPVMVLLGLSWLVWLGHRAWVARQSPPRPAWIASVVTLAVGIMLAMLSRVSHDLHLEDNVEGIPWGPTQVLLALGHQLEHLLIPSSLHPAYPIDRYAADFSDPHVIAGGAVLVAVVLVLFAVRKNSAAVLLVAGAIVVYLPVSSVLPFHRFVADSYLYGPLAFGTCALGVVLADAGFEPGPQAKRAARWVVASLAIIVFGLAPLSIAQQLRWRDGEAMWRPVIEEYPDHGLGYKMTAAWFRAVERHDLATPLYEEGFARDWDENTGLSFADSLIRVGRPRDAECVLYDQFFNTAQSSEAAQIYGLLLAFHPEMEPRHPVVAAMMVNRAGADADAGRWRVADTLEEPFADRRRQLATVDTSGPFPDALRYCPLVRPRSLQ